MLASELIFNLAKAIKENGDKEMMVEYDGSFVDFSGQIRLVRFHGKDYLGLLTDSEE
jgi:hypothetical protein